MHAHVLNRPIHAMPHCFRFMHGDTYGVQSSLSSSHLLGLGGEGGGKKLDLGYAASYPFARYLEYADARNLLNDMPHRQY